MLLHFALIALLRVPSSQAARSCLVPAFGESAKQVGIGLESIAHFYLSSLLSPEKAPKSAHCLPRMTFIDFPGG